jgi:MFS family permease
VNDDGPPPAGPATAAGPVEPVPEQRRVLITLVVAQVLSGAGISAGITVGALLAQDMLGTARLAGLPSALFTIGAAAAATGVGRVSQRHGRRAGLTLGYTVGALGALGALLAAVLSSVPLLFVALFAYGAGGATSLQARYAGADLATPDHKARAVSTVLVATTFGAVAGPNLVTATGSLAATWGIPRLAGPFGLAAVAYGAAALVLFVRLRPDPLLLAQELADREPAGRGLVAEELVAEEHRAAGDGHPARIAEPLVAEPLVAVPLVAGPLDDSPSDIRRGVRLGAAVMVVTQAVMISVMTMTPIHLQHHGHGTDAIGVVIAAHVASMFLPSPLSGRLVDRYGPRVVVGLAAVTLLAAGVVAALAPGGAVWALALGLALLGLGWSLGLVAGTAVLSGDLPVASRARTQGNVDVLVAVAGAGGAALSGLVVAGTSYAALALGGSVLAVCLLPLVLRSRQN